MANRRRKPRLAWRLPDKFKRPVPLETFRNACARADEAVLSPHPLLHERVSPHAILRDEYTGEVEELWRLADAPMNRVNLILRECFPDQLEYMCAATRLWALLDLLDGPRLDAWILVKTPEGCEFHDGLIDVAASAPLGAQGEFLVEPFLAALERWAKAHPEWHAAEMRKRWRPEEHAG
jgi:hypothetical protein